jgi:hypothetical protein
VTQLAPVPPPTWTWVETGLGRWLVAATAQGVGYLGLAGDEVDEMVAAARDAHREQLRLLTDTFQADELGATVHLVEVRQARSCPRWSSAFTQAWS